MSIEETATAFVLGALSPAERAEITRERLYNTELDEHIRHAEQLFAGIETDNAEIALPSTSWERVEQAIKLERDALSGKQVSECSDGEWLAHGPGIEFKTLWSDGIMLIRCNPGAFEATHDQPEDMDEHILVMAGDLDVGGRRFGTGDYICVPAGSVHQLMKTHGGCLLFTEYRPVSAV